MGEDACDPQIHEDPFILAFFSFSLKPHRVENRSKTIFQGRANVLYACVYLMWEYFGKGHLLEVKRNILGVTDHQG